MWNSRCIYLFSQSEISLLTIVVTLCVSGWDCEIVELGDVEAFVDVTVGELRQVGGALTEMEASVLSCSSFSLSKEIIWVGTFFLCLCFEVGPNRDINYIRIKLYVILCTWNEKQLPGIVDDIMGSDNEIFCFSISLLFELLSNSSLSILIANKILPSPNS